ncbi:hypothetical protein [Roseiconus lacunae]|uniref:Uncharacterized protein n=1 Tax=Roseiconus lacunae TaxID=2605694 RepID=A0ABT7PLD7_9BACT|nr:hypothetical protein [Roseiconus lacunae]MCD0460736.1 hypothetical protein [Roseiconus lacunae]MDM4017089.1 hypothetical protein [Roseiconus lacunae]
MADKAWTNVKKGKQVIQTSDASKRLTEEFLSNFSVEYNSSELHRLPRLDELLLSLQMVLGAAPERYCEEGDEKDLVSIVTKTK